MYTISDILADIQRGITANNLNEDYFSYRLVYFVNDVGRGTKFRVDTSYDGLRSALENIIRGHLSTTNTVVVAAVTVRKNRESISLLNRSYSYSLDGYFQKICETNEKDNINSYYVRRKVQWC